jgi:hypothetical protein
MIEPLLVIHHTNERLFVGHDGEQAQDGEGHQEPIRRRSGADAECGPQRVALCRRETLEAIEKWRAHLVQGSERELHLRLDSGGIDDAATRGSVDEVVQERRLAHARFAPYDQRPPLTLANSLDEPVE